jgi:citrate lyase beta subunit
VRHADDAVRAVTAATTLGARVVRMTQTMVDAAVVAMAFTSRIRSTRLRTPPIPSAGPSTRVRI